MKTFAPIAIALATGIISIPVAAKEPANNQEKNITVYDQAPKPSKKAPKMMKENLPAKDATQSSTGDATKKNEKGSTEIIVNPCNGSTPPSWC